MTTSTNTDDVNQLLLDVEIHRSNPSRLTRAAFDYLERASNGASLILDPSNPFVFAVEFAAVLASRNHMRGDVNLSRQYKAMATTEEALYLHMTDTDYLNRFSTPSKATFAFLISLPEVRLRAVATGTDGVRKLVIPRDTTFTVEDTTFTLLYPLEIRIMPHNGLQIVYDGTNKNPMKPLESNIPAWNIYSESGIDFIRIDLETLQLKATRTNNPVIAAGSFSFNQEFEDNFYYARVFMAKANGGWTEIKTTHSDQVYDPLVVTASLRVEENNLRVTIPPVYFTSNMVTDAIRIDVYSTKGSLDLNLLAYESNSINMVMLDYGAEVEEKYYIPINNVSEKSVIGLGKTTGGGNGLTFEQLRNRVIYDSLGNRSQPITSYNIKAELENSGYNGVEIIDNVVKRTFVATKALPNPNLPNNPSGAGCIISTFIARIADLAGLPTVKDNGQRITILPSTIFRRDNGLIDIVPKAAVDGIRALSAEAQAADINGRQLLYTPFHYVFDTTNNRFDARAYYFEDPKIVTKTLEGENATTAIEVSTGPWWLRKIDEGFELIIATRSGESYRTLADDRCFAQLSYRANGETAYAHLNGEFVGVDDTTGERLFSFVLESTFDVNSSDQIYINNFKMFTADTIRELATSLITEFYISFIVTDLTNNYNSSPLDNQVAEFLLPTDIDNYVTVIREKLVLQFGTALQGLWNKSRPIVSPEDYQRYTTNVPYIYEENVYERNPDGSLKFTLDVDNKPVFNILHHVGDTKLDEDDNVVYRYLQGELIRDEFNRPIPKNPRELRYKVDLFFIDGRYAFATNAKTVAYRESVPRTVVEWVDKDINGFTNRLIEETDLFFYPLTTIGQIQVITQESDPITINAEQGFNVQLYVDQVVIDNLKLQKDMSETITKELDAMLQARTVSFLNISARLRAVLGDGVYGASVSGLGGSLLLNTITTRDDSQRAVLKKKMVVDSDGFLSVQVDINIDFILHTLPR